MGFVPWSILRVSMDIPYSVRAHHGTKIYIRHPILVNMCQINKLKRAIFSLLCSLTSGLQVILCPNTAKSLLVLTSLHLIPAGAAPPGQEFWGRLIVSQSQRPDGLSRSVKGVS